MLFFPRTKTSVVYQWHCSWLRHLALYTDWEGDLSMIFLDTIMCICSESSSNGLPTLVNSFFRGSESCWNIFSKEAVFLWCLVSCLLLHCWRSPPRSQASELFWDQQSTILLMLWDCQISQLPPPCSFDDFIILLMCMVIRNPWKFSYPVLCSKLTFQKLLVDSRVLLG